METQRIPLLGESTFDSSSYDLAGFKTGGGMYISGTKFQGIDWPKANALATKAMLLWVESDGWVQKAKELNFSVVDAKLALLTLLPQQTFISVISVHDDARIVLVGAKQLSEQRIKPRAESALLLRS